MDKMNEEITKVKQRFSIVGIASALENAVSRAIQVGSVDLSVLVLGESGSGKEFFPKIIHEHSKRKHKPYMAINCGALPEGTINSELFGHEKGAFSGAVSERKGYFETVNGGTIFLDEVGEMPLSTQARLLRVLESGEFLKVGSSTVQKTDVRIVAATNKDLLKAVSKGEFREDLYYRLSTIVINVPPLRERGDDVMLLARKFASSFADNYRMPKVEFLEGARNVILGYRWPGNVRQLKNVIEQVALFEAGNKVDEATMKTYLPQYNNNVYKPVVASTHNYNQERDVLFGMMIRMQRDIDDLRSQIESISNNRGMEISSTTSALEKTSKPQLIHYPTANGNSNPNEVEYSEVEADEVEAIEVERIDVDSKVMTLEDTEKETIRCSLERNSGNRRRTAEELNISERTLYRKIKEFGLE